jgi:hypothetical protein
MLAFSTTFKSSSLVVYCLICISIQNTACLLVMLSLVNTILFLRIALIAASPTLAPTSLLSDRTGEAVRDMNLLNQKSHDTPNRDLTGWSRQDIFTLVSVCVAVIGIFISVLVASPAVRKWLYTPFHCKLASF